uniref:Uncharacterized protein n=1 Tax=Anguilla anguilla TaxID=7936 RepID=A0A0E9UTF1_ANGAN
MQSDTPLHTDFKQSHRKLLKTTTNQSVQSLHFSNPSFVVQMM